MYNITVTVKYQNESCEFTFVSDTDKSARKAFHLLEEMFESGYNFPCIKDHLGNILAELKTKKKTKKKTVWYHIMRILGKLGLI